MSVKEKVKDKTSGCQRSNAKSGTWGNDNARTVELVEWSLDPPPEDEFPGGYLSPGGEVFVTPGGGEYYAQP